VTLSASNAQIKTSKLSDVTFQMRNALRAMDSTFTAVVKLKMFTFSNMFYNIEEGNNVMKIVSSWNTPTGFQEQMITIVVPPGNYTTEPIDPSAENDEDVINSNLVAYLNQHCNGSVDGFYVGMGVEGDATQKGFLVQEGTNQLVFEPPNIASLGAPDEDHLYLGFYLVYDAETAALMEQLGLIQRENGTVTTPGYGFCPGTNKQGLGFNAIVAAGGGSYTYQVVDGVYATPLNAEMTGVAREGANPMNLGTCPALLLSWEQISSKGLNSCDQMTTGDTFATVPVMSAYGNRTTFADPVPYECYVTNFNVTQFHIQIRRADTGQLVDFKGVNWVMVLVIEFKEVENQPMSTNARNGIGKQIMPTNQNERVNHLLPFSGQKRVRYSEFRPEGVIGSF
jgi:hypothetical protein